MKLYALYQGDKFIKIDTLENLANELGIKKESLRFCATPTYLKRTGGKGRVLVPLD